MNAEEYLKEIHPTLKGLLEDDDGYIIQQTELSIILEAYCQHKLSEITDEVETYLKNATARFSGREVIACNRILDMLSKLKND